MLECSVYFLKLWAGSSSASCRSTRLKVLCKKGVLYISQNLQVNTCIRVLYNKVPGLRPAIFIKKEAPTEVFSCEFCEIFNYTFLQNISGGCFLSWAHILCPWNFTFKLSLAISVLNLIHIFIFCLFFWISVFQNLTLLYFNYNILRIWYIVCTSPLLPPAPLPFLQEGVEPPTKFSKSAGRGGAWQDLNF